MNRSSLIVLIVLLSIVDTSVVGAQSFGKTKKSGSVEGSPLDTILSTRLWTTPPTAKDFVRQSRPDPSSLDYTPLHGTDPARPKPRDAANVRALQAELEHDIQMNEKKALALGGVIKPDATGLAHKKRGPATER